MTFFSALAPRHLGTLLPLLCVGGAMIYSTTQQTPVGQVRGRAVVGDTQKPLAHVKITLTSGAEFNDDEGGDESDGGAEVRRYRAVTDAKGRFEIKGVDAGLYHLSATSRAHSSDEESLLVREDESLDVPLKLDRSQPDLQLTQRQREFLPTESVTLPLHGYVDGAKAPNSDSLRVRVFRTRLADVLRDTKATEALGKISNRYEPVTTIPAQLLHPGGAAPRLIETRVVPLRGADIEGFYHQRLKLGNLPAGLYLVDVAHGKRSVCAQMLVSDTAVVVKKTRTQLLAYAVDSQSGAPRAGAAIQIFQGGENLAKARTDKQGLAKIELPAGREGGDKLLTLASFGNSEATVGQYDSEGESDEKRGGFKVHAYTDRPIYRPGDRVAYKGIARRVSEASDAKRYAVPVGEAVDVEVRDESGGRVAKSQLKTNKYGSFHGDFELSSEVPSGNYSMVMSVAGEEHTADFTVASYRKPEFTATVVSNEKHYAFGDKVEMMVAGTYYFGAPVAGGKVHYTVLRAPDWSSLYADETDEDNEDEENAEGGYADDSGEMVEEGDLTLDANGHAVVRFEANDGSGDEESENGESADASFEEPQDQTYTVDVTLTDAAGREVEASGQVPVTAGDFRLSAQTDGYFALPNQKTGISVKAQDFNGKPLAGKTVVLSGTYSSDSTKNEGDKAKSDSKTAPKPALRLEATTGADGIAKIAFTPPREGVLNLSAQSRDAQNREILATRSLWVSGDEGGDYDAQYNTLSLLTDKKRYKAGETARVLINAEESGGTALVTLEGSKLFREWLVPLRHHSTALKVPLGANYGPNVTLAVCMVRDQKYQSSQAPLRVEVPQRAIKVAVASDKAKYEPGEKVTYRVQTSDFAGKPVAANLSFGVVDEAIYALQGDDAGALRRAFYPANPNDVETNYSFEPLYLGDVSKSEVNIEARRKFVDTAFWQSDVETDAQGRASVSFDLPDNLTTWRATATAQTLDSAFGRRTQKLTVAKDFFVRLDTPRFFTGGDGAQITALVHNNTGENQSATLQIDAQGLGLQGATSQTVDVASGAVGQVVWPVSTDAAGLNFDGIARLKLSGWTSGNKKWTDALETSVPIRPHGRERIENFVGNLQSGAITQKIALDPSAVASASQVTVRLTPSISDSLVGAVRYLTGFPYGCTEQTMSRFLPDILVQRTLRLRGARDAEAQKLAAQLPKMVRDSVTRLGRFQHQSGGWGWWENDDDDAWMTAYVIYGLSQARAEGYEVSDDMIAKGREAALKMLGKPNKKLPAWQQRNWENTRSFLLYALAGASPTGKELNALRAQRAALSTDELGSQALGYLVLLDKQLGLQNTVWPQLEAQLKSEGQQLLFWEGDGHDEWADWNDKTATAVGLRALMASDPDDKRIPSVLLYLMAHRQDDAWGNTRDTSWVLGALCDYLNAHPVQNRYDVLSAIPGALQVQLNGKTLQTTDLTPAASQGELVLRIPPQKLRASGNVLTLQRTNSGEPVFYAIRVRQTLGDDQLLPAVTSAIPIAVTRQYRRLLAPSKGQSGWDLKSEATTGALKQGDRIRVRLTFETPRDLSYVLIEDAFPSGCETSERGSAEEGNEEWDKWWSNTDVRDDRIAFFARRMSKGKHTIEYNLRAQTRGTYSALPTLLQAMYAPEVRAESAESRVQID